MLELPSFLDIEFVFLFVFVFVQQRVFGLRGTSTVGLKLEKAIELMRGK